MSVYLQGDKNEPNNIDHYLVIDFILKGFVDGNFEWNLYAFIRPNQVQLRKMQLSALWQESNPRPCDPGAAL